MKIGVGERFIFNFFPTALNNRTANKKIGVKGFSEKQSPNFFICLYLIGAGWDENLNIFGMALSPKPMNP